MTASNKKIINNENRFVPEASEASRGKNWGERGVVGVLEKMSHFVWK